MRHLVSIRDLSPENIRDLIDKSLAPRSSGQERPGELVALVFLEPSTRTRVSFECAAHQLKAHPILVQKAGTSLEKSESYRDTFLVLRSMGVRVFILRCQEEGVMQELSRISGIRLINGGDGRREHPTQALQDLLTLRSYYNWKDLTGKVLTIVGDLKNSRVAQSWAYLAPQVGIKLQLVSPIEWRPTEWAKDCVHFDSLQEGLRGADFVMGLRVQRERHNADDAAVVESYVKNFQITEKNLPPKALLMHPGPTNWGVELSSELQNHPRSLILLQIKHGVDLRRTVLSELFATLDASA